VQITVLVADDDAMLRSLLCDIIKKQGYVPVSAVNGRDAVDIFFSRTDISLCILDVMMPLFSGWDVLAEIRRKSDVPVLMLTALGDEQHEIRGMKNGADDYISKPFSYPVLLARIEALLRRVKKQQHEILTAGSITVDMAAHSAAADGRELVLTNKEFQLLVLFMRHPSVVLERDRILEQVWGFDFDGDMRTIDAHIKMLRAKLGTAGNYIRTVRGTGYQFEADDEKKYTD